jgi:hypothetical protein
MRLPPNGIRRRRFAAFWFLREIREIRSSKANDDFRSTELALQTSHSDGMVG